MKEYRCPLCNSLLDSITFNHVIGIDKAKKKEIANQISQAKQEATITEQKRQELLISAQAKQLEQANATIKHLQEGTTPQLVGFRDEAELTLTLRKYYPTDDIQHKGKKGDVLHFIIADGKQAGIILYECKNTKTIDKSHISQASRDKQKRNADLAVLVTRGKAKWFAGYDYKQDVHICHPLTVIALVNLLRDNLIKLAQSKLNPEEKANALQTLQSYMADGKVHSVLNNISLNTIRIAEDTSTEIMTHYTMWNRRLENTKNIFIDAFKLDNNIHFILEGKPPEDEPFIPLPQPLVKQLPEYNKLAGEQK